MVANLYCSRADVNRELPIGSPISPSGIVASCLASTDALTFDGHGLETGDALNVRAGEGGTLSAPFVAGTTYYAIRVSNSAFKLASSAALAAAGTALDITTNGVSMIVAREPRYDERIEFYSRWADGMLPGHLVPLAAPIHPIVLGVVARCAARQLLADGGQDSALVAAQELAAKAILERYAAGLPLRGATVTASSNLATRASTAAATADPLGWGSGVIL